MMNEDQFNKLIAEISGLKMILAFHATTAHGLGSPEETVRFLIMAGLSSEEITTLLTVKFGKKNLERFKIRQIKNE